MSIGMNNERVFYELNCLFGSDFLALGEFKKSESYRKIERWEIVINSTLFLLFSISVVVTPSVLAVIVQGVAGALILLYNVEKDLAVK